MADSVYARARENFDELIRTGYLVREQSPSLYIYRLAWHHHAQIGVVGCCPIGHFENGTIRKHERTRPDKVADRTHLLHAVGAHTGPIFLAYRDCQQIDTLVEEIINERPLYHFNAPDGVTHSLWRVAQTSRLAETFRVVPNAYVADGHHRVASAEKGLAERRESGEPIGEYDRLLCVLFPSSQLTILPYNRIVQNIDGMTPANFLDRVRDVARVSQVHSAIPERAGSIHCFAGDRWYAVELPNHQPETDNPADHLDAARLHTELLTPILGIGDPRTDDRCAFIGGTDSTQRIESLVRSGEAFAGFSLCATTMEQLMDVADAGLVMPPKSTWFEPKLCSGLLIHSVE